MMVPSMVHKIEMETVFDKISAKLNLCIKHPNQRTGIQVMVINAYSAPLIFICGIDFYAK